MYNEVAIVDPGDVGNGDGKAGKLTYFTGGRWV